MRWLWLSVVVIILDQLSKLYITEYLTQHPPVELTSWLNLILAHNTGAAFSFLGDAGGWQRWFFVALSSVVSIILVVWIVRSQISIWLSCALALILGGAVGNLIDRTCFGYVVDFIDFHIDSLPWPLLKFSFNTWDFEKLYIHNWHFATFNIADAAISVGAVLMLIDAFFLSTQETETE